MTIFAKFTWQPQCFVPYEIRWFEFRHTLDIFHTCHHSELGTATTLSSLSVLGILNANHLAFPHQNHMVTIIVIQYNPNPLYRSLCIKSYCTFSWLYLAKFLLLPGSTVTFHHMRCIIISPSCFVSCIPLIVSYSWIRASIVVLEKIPHESKACLPKWT